MSMEEMQRWLADQLPHLTNTRGELLTGIIEIFKSILGHEAQRYTLKGKTTEEQLQTLSTEVKPHILSNNLQHYHLVQGNAFNKLIGLT